MNIQFLEAKTPLTKTFTATKTGLVKAPYPMTWEFSSHREPVQNLAQFEAALKRHAAKGHCLLKGQLVRDLVNESRAGTTNTNDQTEWICLDFDDAPLQTVNTALVLMGLKDVSYVLQYSASAEIENQNLRAHVFMLLDKPASAPLLKQWLIHLNHSVPELRAAMTLVKTGNSIRWPLDVSACQNDKLIYIAPPILNGVPDPFKGKQRISLVKRKLERLTLPGGFSTEKNKELTSKRIGELREAEGLPKRAFRTKMHGSIEVLAKPDTCTITEMKQERGFVYFNLNGGDSWAYYHPENNPDFIFNFKGEPAYLTKELLPDYWQQLTAQTVKVDSNGLQYLAFCDRKTSAYWRGTYDTQTDTLDLHQAKNETQVRHFAKQHGMPLGDFIPEWDLIFDPKDSVHVDFQNKCINQFTPSAFMKMTNLKQVQKVPPVTFKIISHALGGDLDIVEHFLNWLAFIVQERDRTTTSWVLHGTQGTGKGLLTNNILRPLLGQTNLVFKRMEELAEQYNVFMRDVLLVVVDEVQTSALVNERAVAAKLRNFISEEYVPIRDMRTASYQWRNYTNWIFNSNMPDPVSIPANDRRTNVAKYQPDRLQITQKEISKIDAELVSFFSYLLFYPCDHEKARTVIETKDRTTMISIGESSIDTVSTAILEGRFDFLMDQLPSGVQVNTSFAALQRVENYKHILRALLERTVERTNMCSIARDELRVLYEFVIGSMPESPNKFTSLLKHHRVHMDKVWVNNLTVNGIRVHVQQTKAERELMLDLLAPKVVTGNAATTGKKVVSIAAGKK